MFCGPYHVMADDERLLMDALAKRAGWTAPTVQVSARSLERETRLNRHAIPHILRGLARLGLITLDGETVGIDWETFEDQVQLLEEHEERLATHAAAVDQEMATQAGYPEAEDVATHQATAEEPTPAAVAPHPEPAGYPANLLAAFCDLCASQERLMAAQLATLRDLAAHQDLEAHQDGDRGTEKARQDDEGAVEALARREVDPDLLDDADLARAQDREQVVHDASSCVSACAPGNYSSSKSSQESFQENKNKPGCPESALDALISANNARLRATDATMAMYVREARRVAQEREADPVGAPVFFSDLEGAVTGLADLVSDPDFSLDLEEASAPDTGLAFLVEPDNGTAPVTGDETLTPQPPSPTIQAEGSDHPGAVQAVAHTLADRGYVTRLTATSAHLAGDRVDLQVTLTKPAGQDELAFAAPSDVTDEAALAELQACLAEETAAAATADSAADDIAPPPGYTWDELLDGHDQREEPSRLVRRKAVILSLGETHWRARVGYLAWCRAMAVRRAGEREPAHADFMPADVRETYAREFAVPHLENRLLDAQTPAYVSANEQWRGKGPLLVSSWESQKDQRGGLANLEEFLRRQLMQDYGPEPGQSTVDWSFWNATYTLRRQIVMGGLS